MSTRSGKRIHSSLLEDTPQKETEPAVKSERKTRSKRVKENLEELSVSIYKNKKRNNYVSYPTDDELNSDTALNKVDELKPSRVLRKNALKEQNAVENETSVSQAEAKSLTRKSRRGKRLEDAEETENHENVPAEVTEVPKSKKSKKKKKVSAVIDNPPPNEEAPAKKSKKKKKKGKKTNSMTIEDIPQNDNSKNGTFNRSNMSIDSFHSAAGSPVNVHENMNRTPSKKSEEIPKSSLKTNKKLSKNDTFDRNNISMDKVDEKINNTFDKGSKNKAELGKCFVSVTQDDLESMCFNSNLSNGHLKRRKSNIRDDFIDQSNISSPIEQNNEENNLNMSQKQSRRRRSSIKVVEPEMSENTKNNDTFDKGLRKRQSVTKDTTFDRSNVSITKEISERVDFNVSNMSNKSNKTRKSVMKDSTFDKSNASVSKEDSVRETDLNVSHKHPKARKSILKDTTFEKSNTSIVNIIEKGEELGFNTSNISTKRLRRTKSYDSRDTLNTTFEKNQNDKKDSTFDKSANKNLNTTFEKNESNQKKSSVNTSYETNSKAKDTTFEKDNSTSFDTFKKGAMTRKSDIRDATFDKSNMSIASLTKEDFEKDNHIISSSATKRRSSRRYTMDISGTINEGVVNTTFEKSIENQPRRKSSRISQSTDFQTKLNTTFEKENNQNEKSQNSKSLLISSDNSIVDKSDISRISITSDDTAESIENIVNTTPVLIESSMDESRVSVTKAESPKETSIEESQVLVTKTESPKPQTPLKREGTFTKDGPEVGNELETPTKSKSTPIPAAGCTPYHITKSSQKKSLLNVTRSIEKGFTSVDPAPRMTRVMFCSPVDNPVFVAQEKRKVIKSNLKGSNKSFVFEESVSVPRPGRKRSYTQNDADEARAKRTRLTEDLKQSVDRLSRPRTTSATAKLSLVTPKKGTTPSKPKSEGRVSRTRLPNFAAMHQKQFDKMESLDQCQERRAKRAKQLLTPTAPPGLLERISPKNTIESPKSKEQAKPIEKTDTPTKKLPTLESLRPGFTRFGFKLNLDVNPFSIPSKTEKIKEKVVEKPVENIEKLNGVIPPRPGVLPSLAGATSVRREAAKLTVMREKSFTEKRNVKRNENRTIIKGVRTNRRFELQMKLRNIE